MGTEKDKCRSVNRNRPPPVPPRPQHLMSAASMSKYYTSMPDILNGWRKDANPDLLKSSNGTLSSKTSSLDVSPPYSAKEGGIFNGFMKTFRDKDPGKSSMYRGCSADTVNRCGAATKNGPEEVAARKTSRKFSCIPKRSNSKKNKKIMAANDDTNNRSGKCNNNRSEISQTSWYVEDVGNTVVQLSKCEITLNYDNNCRYALEETSATAPASITKNNFLHKVRNAKHQSTMASSSSLSGLPPLPKSLSDASLLWDPSDKKSLSYSVNLSPSSSSASSSSRTSSHYSKQPLPTSSRSNSLGKDSQKSLIVHLAGNGTRDEKRPTPPPPPPRKPTSLDMKLATLRKEMYDLRQMDLALLSQLWSLNEAIIEFRQMQMSPNSPSYHSSDEEDSGCYYSNVSSQGMVTSNQHINTLGSSSSRSSISTTRSTLRENVKI